MQTTCRVVSRLLGSSKYTCSSVSINSSLSNLSQLVFLEPSLIPHNQGFFQFRSYTNIGPVRGFSSVNSSRRFVLLGFVLPENDPIIYQHHRQFYSPYRSFFTRAKQIKKIEINDQHIQRAVTTALWCNFLVFSLKFGVWLATSSHVMLAEMVHSIADFANQALLAYGLSSSRRAPDAMHPYGYSKERFVWSLISAVGIFCLGSGATIVHGVQNLWTSHPPANIEYAALVIGGSFMIEGASLVVAIQAVKKGAAAEGMKVRDYVWRGHDPTSVAVMTEDFNGVVVVQNYLHRTGREEWARQFREAAKEKDDSALLKIMSNYGEEVVTALGSEVDRLEKEIQELVPGIRHVDIEAHNPIDLSS
ncbi:Cation efflux family protein isoform 3 [Theobroma cacao]|uniref:Cation efflux family protein isoform 3 n=1 Tax=Theobroma cacao TaxID=3641 RepID=A0A061GH29_THECC|nr:Cation efflux family protein isoform 3 [Theobroma cacao]